MRQKIEYIHLNPVKRGYVDEHEHWRYSSAWDYAGIVGLLEVCTTWQTGMLSHAGAWERAISKKESGRCPNYGGKMRTGHLATMPSDDFCLFTFSITGFGTTVSILI